MWVSFKQRLVGARARSWGIVTSLGRWSSSSKTSSRLARPRVPSVRPWTCTHPHACVRTAPGWFAVRWAAPQLYWATSYYDNATRCARTPEKQKRERRASSPLFCTALPLGGQFSAYKGQKHSLDRERRLVVSPIRIGRQRKKIVRLRGRKTLSEQTRVRDGNN